MDFTSEWRVGGVVDGHRLERELGVGGMGEVFLARGLARGQLVALKVLPREVSDLVRERFCREGEAQARADGHPHVLRVRSAGVVEGRAYLVLDYASGGDLEERIARGALSIETVFDLGEALASALGHVHAQGVVHRDLKPSNVIFDEAGVPLLADFGLARFAGANTLTSSQVAIGTPGYLAPEQADRTVGATDERTDVYGLGALLFAAASGRAPFEGSGIQLLTAGLIKEAPRLRDLRPDAPAALEAIVARCLRKVPAERFASAEALASALRAARAGTYRDEGRGRGSALALTLLVLGLALALAVGAWVWGGGRSGPGADAFLTAARLEIAPLGSASLIPRVELRGRATGAPLGAQVRVAGGAARDLAPGGGFALTARLEPGPNALHVLLLDAEGAVLAEARLEHSYHSTPRWYQLLGPSRRPPLPLPPGLEFAEEAREYAYRDGSRLVYVPPGEFVMGRPEDDLAGVLFEEDRSSARSFAVRLTRGYFLGKYELTWGQWGRFCRESGRVEHLRQLNYGVESERGVGVTLTPGAGEDFLPGDRHPVHGLSWIDAQAYCAHYGLRLPSEAEWEYAARGEGTGPYPWGNEPPSPALLNRRDPHDPWPYTAPVDACPKGASPFGCLNMAGNVAEYVADPHAPYSASAKVDPRGPAEGPLRVWRGYDWSVNQIQAFYVYQRWAVGAEQRKPCVGLRVALSAEPPAGR